MADFESGQAPARRTGLPGKTARAEGFGTESPESAPQKSEGCGVDLNTASAVELERLPGLGPVKSRRVVEDRRRRGPFRCLEDLERVKGVGPKTLERLRAYLYVRKGDPAGATSLNPPAQTPEPGAPGEAGSRGMVRINTAGSQRLQALPGIGPVLARRIIEYRRTHGPFRQAEDLLGVKGIGTVTLHDVRPYLNLELLLEP